MAESLIAKNGEGILGFITNHGYLDNPTFRGMRWHLMQTFDALYVLDLHGNTKKKEIAPDGSTDKNVFDIQQGVAILIAVRTRREPPTAAGKGKKTKAPPLAKVLHHELYGSRQGKYTALQALSLGSQAWQTLKPGPPQYAFVPRNTSLEAQYQQGFSLPDFMPVNSVGIVTARDALTIDMDKNSLWQRAQRFAGFDVETARREYDLGEDVRDWSVSGAQKDLNNNLDEANIVPISYRPFDTRWTYYTGNSRGFMCYPRGEVMRHMFRDNFAFSYTRRIEQARDFADILVVNNIITHHSLSIKEVNNLAPLYIYADADLLNPDDKRKRSVNFDPKLFAALQAKAIIKNKTPNAEQAFDYIYGVLHCPSYRETYADFLKTDFPRIPYPATPEAFWAVSEQGQALRKLHLMDAETLNALKAPVYTQAPEAKPAQPNTVLAPAYKDGKVWINEAQYFDAVPESTWAFYIGGYQPAQKWLKDRKGQTLARADILHYQNILRVLTETQQIMAKIMVPQG